MRTPIADFVREYANKSGCRFHMPGHKGRAFLGCEAFDITEIKGADALYEAEGIIDESEKNATELFETARTLYSTEGSSQCIRAMLQLAVGYANLEYHKEKGVPESAQERRPYVIAARNVHKAFLYAAALIDFDVVWLYPREMHSLCSCEITTEQLEAELCRQIELHHGRKPAAVYVTSPDYLGGQIDIATFAKVCHHHDTILAVDNAHGAYLHFLDNPKHPMDLGADICCDSAHKTLPVLTGGAYLQISKQAPVYFAEHAKQAMVLFGSTSPSYLTLASLDLCNAYLADGYEKRLAVTVEMLTAVRKELQEMGWQVEETDPLKVTIKAREGVTGTALAELLRTAQIECEYADEAYLVLMVTPENGEEDLKWFVAAMQGLTDRYSGRTTASQEKPLQPVHCKQNCSIRTAIFSGQETVKVTEALGRTCGEPTVSCPPAIPIAVPGEVMNEKAIRLFRYYGIERVSVLKEVSSWEEQ